MCSNYINLSGLAKVGAFTEQMFFLMKTTMASTEEQKFSDLWS